MRKLLLGLITVLLLALSIYMAVYGISLGSIQVNGIPAIQEENLKLDNKIENASKVRNTDYPNSVTALEGAYKKLMTEKESYEQIVALGVDENGNTLNKIQEYEMEKIWVTMGNYAKKQGVDLKMDITSNNSITKTYDLNFTITGGYIQIIDFLYDIERDSTLVFKIENFKLVAGETTDVLVGTFAWRDVKLKISEINGATEEKEETQDKENSPATQSTDTSKENNKTNTTNTTNTTN